MKQIVPVQVYPDRECIPGLTTDQIVEMRIHGVSPEFVREMGESGLGDLSFDDLIEMGTHGVDPDYIREMRENAA